MAPKIDGRIDGRVWVATAAGAFAIFSVWIWALLTFK